MRPTFLPGAAAFLAATAVALLGLEVAAGPGPGGEPADEVVQLRLLGVNDLHGHLEPPRPGIGGVAWLKAHLDRETLPGRSIRVHAGDMVGTSPLVSSWFHDEPAIEAANQIGFDVGTLGNHEFDEGGEELMRLLRGGRRTGPEALKADVDGRVVNTSEPGFPGTRFPTIAANSFDRDGRLVLPPYHVVERAGTRVGFIGVTTTSTPRWLLRRHGRPFRFGDVSDAVNRWVTALRRRGIEAIVVLAHEGAPEQYGSDPYGPVVEETLQMDDAVDVVVAGHSHSRLNMRVGGKLVVEAGSYGTAYDAVDLAIDRRTGDVVAASARVPRTTHGSVGPDRALEALVAERRARVGPLAERVLGRLRAPLTRAARTLAPVVAAAQRSYSGADVAVVSPASVRGDLDAGPVTYEEVFAAQPFDHRLLMIELAGSDLAALLRSTAETGVHTAIPEPLEPERRYSVVASELLVDQLSGLREPARSARAAGTEVEALSAYFSRGER